MALQHLRSSTANKRPTPGSMSDGQLALNTNVASPGAFFKDSTGALVKAGPVHVGTTAPNASPAVGGQSGNSIGEQWLDTSASPAQLKVWNGTAWVSALPDELPVSKLADGSARQLLQTDAAGTGVEWTSNVDVPGTLDVTGAATFDSTVSIGGSNALVASDIGSTVQAYDADTAKIDVTQTFTAAQTFGDNVTLNAQSDLRFADSDSSNWVAFQAPATVASNITWTLPNADGTSGQVLSTDGAGALSWATAAAGAGDKIEEDNTSAEVIDTGSDGRFVVTTEGSERARVDSSGRLLVGTSSARSNIYSGGSAVTPTLQLENNTNTWSNGLSIINYSGSQYGASLALGMSASNTPGTNALVTTGNLCGKFHFLANDGTNFYPIAEIGGWTDGTTGTGDVPGRLTFSTTADGASSPTERMRITSAGHLLVSKTTLDPAVAGIQLRNSGLLVLSTNSGSECMTLNRQDSDGTLIEFRQANSIEGNITVSGTTVSYNGAHLSRWSQLPSGAERTEILRGTVLSNIDEMCEWGEEDNEQLNRMKVSDVEGDKNVSGVFQAWDDDDDTYTNDLYCAMTGDFIIRIAAGVTVERGDLLMSAGDGTAKPQDDDIIRSKTIAKVTSTNVSCTYDDGSYCVPCVLMAC